MWGLFGFCVGSSRIVVLIDVWMVVLRWDSLWSASVL